MAQGIPSFGSTPRIARWRQALACRRGISTMMIAASMPVLLGFMGYAIDNGMWSRQHARLQMAADAAAMGAARLLANTNATTANFQSAALAEAQGAAGGGLIGTLSTPVGVSVASDRRSVSVSLVSTASRSFTQILSTAPVTLHATAMAGLTAASACVAALNPTIANAIDIENNGTINASGCGVFSNSTNSSSIYVRNGVLSGQSIGTSGGAVASSNGSSTITPAATTYAPPFSDPYAAVTAPAAGACSGYATTYNSGTWYLQPGVYCGGLTVQNGGTVNFAPGLYTILNGNFVITGGATVNTASGASFYLGGSSVGCINWQNYATTTISMSAMTTGWMAGILIYQDRSAASMSSTCSVVGGSTLSLSGVIYLPKSQLVLNNNATLTHPGSGGLAVIAQSINVQGSAQLQAGGTIAGTATASRLVLLQ